MNGVADVTALPARAVELSSRAHGGVFLCGMTSDPIPIEPARARVRVHALIPESSPRQPRHVRDETGHNYCYLVSRHITCHPHPHKKRL